MLYCLPFFLTTLLWAEVAFGFWRKPSSKVVEGKISDIVRRENPFKSISDSGIVAKLADKGILLLTKAVQLHRQQLGIPDFKQRRRDALKQEIDELVAGESVFAPITDQQILRQLQQLVEDEPPFAPLTARDLVARIQDAGFSLTAIQEWANTCVNLASRPLTREKRPQWATEWVSLSLAKNRANPSRT